MGSAPNGSVVRPGSRFALYFESFFAKVKAPRYPFARMATRPIGSTAISFGLVSIPVKLYTATSSQSVHFNQLHKKCGGRLKQRLYCPTDDEYVERDDKRLQMRSSSRSATPMLRMQ